MFSFLLPRCEHCNARLNSSHSPESCARSVARGMSRRFFLMAGVGAAVVLAKPTFILEPGDTIRVIGPTIAYPSVADIVEYQIAKVRPGLIEIFEMSDHLAMLLKSRADYPQRCFYRPLLYLRPIQGGPYET